MAHRCPLRFPLRHRQHGGCLRSFGGVGFAVDRIVYVLHAVAALVNVVIVRVIGGAGGDLLSSRVGLIIPIAILFGRRVAVRPGKGSVDVRL